MNDEKIVCSECEWHGCMSDLLMADNPFGRGTIRGCPNSACFAINSYHRACDELGCWEPATCETPMPGGYRHTCGPHGPKDAS
jgi:hypothetical protein